MGLRERRRRQTSADIRDAAVRLARERGARIAIELTVCHDTPSSAAMAEIVVRSIINRRILCAA
jgi:hypothetical protein